MPLLWTVVCDATAGNVACGAAVGRVVCCHCYGVWFVVQLLVG